MGEPAGDTCLEISIGNQNGLVVGLQPILRWLRVFGTDLDVGQSRSKIRRFSFTLSAVLVLVLVVTANAINIYLSPVKKIPKNISACCNALRKIARVGSAILFQTAFLSMTLFSWKKLWKAVKRMEKLITYRADFTNKLRRPLIGILTVVLTVVRSSTPPFHFTLRNCTNN